MHVTNRRLICRIAFLALCVLPTLLVIGRIVAYSIPGYRSSVQSQLAAMLGVGVSLGEVSHPRPGLVMLTNLRLVDPETDGILATVQDLKVALRSDRTVVRLGDATFQGRYLKKFYQTLHDGILCAPGNLAVPFQLDSSKIILRQETGELTLNNLQIDYVPSSERSEATFTFHAADLGMSGPIVIRITRHHRVPTPTTAFALQTHNSRLPCSGLAPFLPFVKRCGLDCTFNGAVWGVAHTDLGWQGEGAFELSSVDLERLLGDRLSHHWSGDCTVQCESVRAETGRLTELRGTLVVRDGSVSGSLLQAARQELRVRHNASHDTYPADELIDFRELAVDLQLDQAGLELRGRRWDGYEDVLMYDDAGGIILREPDPLDQPLPTIKLVRIVDPSMNILRPATANLLHFLPIPGQVTNE